MAVWTRLTACFTHLHNANPTRTMSYCPPFSLTRPTRASLKMADACPGLTFDRLSWTTDWHIREETYSKALAEIINVHHKLPFARNWGDGTTSFSDGQAFPISTRRPATATINVQVRARSNGHVLHAQTKQYWDSLLRLTCSIGLGTVSASLILGKLAAYPAQNGLAWRYVSLAESSGRFSH